MCMALWQRRFVAGVDTDYVNYADIDNDASLDESDERNADMEEIYFSSC